MTVDMDADRKRRIEKWVKARWENGEDFGDTAQLLLEFEQYLDKCEEERQRA